MTIRKKGVKFLSDFMHKGTRYRKAFNDKDEAAKYEKDFKRYLDEGWPVDKFLRHKHVEKKQQADVTVQEMFDLVLENVWKGLPNYDNGFSHSKMFTKAFGKSTPIKDITTPMIYAFKKQCEDAGNAPATIKLKLSSLSTALNFCVENGYLEKRPNFPKIKVKNERLVFFSKEEEQDILAFLEETGEDYFYDFFCWQMDTGCRPSEARWVEPRHVRTDEQLGYVVDLFKTKNGEQRTVPLTRRALAAFKNHQQKDYLWGYWTKERIRTVWDKVREHLGRTNDKNFVFYLTRHTCGSRIVQATGSIYLVKQMLGHKTLDQSMRYGQLAPHNLRQALCALDGGLEVSDKKVANLSDFSGINLFAC